MLRTQVTFIAAIVWLGANACSSDSPPAGGSATGGTSAVAQAGSSAAGSSASGAGKAGANAGGSSATRPATGGSSAAGSTATSSSAGAGGSSVPPAANGGSGGASAAAGAGGAAAQPPATMRATECNGVKFPPRALGTGTYPYAVGPDTAGLPPYWPTDAWKTETPDKLGFDAAKLNTALEFKTQYSNTQAIFVVRHGYVAAEKYVGSFTATSRHESYSMAKSFTSGLVGIAIEEGKLSGTDAKICEYYPDNWDCSDTSDPRSRITVEHAMNLTTGLEWHEDWRTGATGGNDAISLDILSTALSRKAVDEPGMKRRYSTGDPALLTAVIHKSAGKTALAYAKEKIFDVIGTPDIRWNSDSMGRTTVYAGMQATASEFAKYGYLVLNRGKWDGKQVIPAAWIDKTTQATKPCEQYNQWLWHINLPLRFGKQPADCVNSGMTFCPPTDIADVPPDGFTAKGVNGQFIMIIPSVDLVVVRLSADQPGSERWDEYGRGLLTGILDAIKP